MLAKIKAFVTHLFISATLIGIFVYLVYYIWYPTPFFDISGVIEPLKLLVFVDVIIGPMLTLIVYKKGKRTLVFDLIVIFLLQISALVYGAYAINEGRPGLIVFNNGEFHYIIEKYAKTEDLSFDELKPTFFSKPKYGYLEKLNAFDIYNSYMEIEPMGDYDLILKPHSVSIGELKSRFTNKSKQIDALVSGKNSEELAFFFLKKGESGYYVLYSKPEHGIVDYLKF